MTSLIRSLAFGIFALGAWGGPLAAQSETAAETLSVAPGYRVRLTTDADTLEGRWLGPDDGALRIDVDGAVRAVPRERLRRLWVQGTRARTGALVGSAAGGVVLGVFVGLLAEAYCEVDCGGGDDFAGGLAVGGGVGALGGGILGGVVGSWILAWRPVWP